VLAGAVVAIVAAASIVAGTAKSDNGGFDGPKAGKSDLPGPIALKQRELVKRAVQLKLQGKLPKSARIARLGIGKKAKGDKNGKAKGTQFVELERTGEDTIWTVLAEFGDQTATHNHGTLGVIDHGGTPGPLHSQIPQPDRAVDNTTIWAPNFDVNHFKDLLF
jgi:immune inhibitor A